MTRRNRHTRSEAPQYDETIMQELLDQPAVSVYVKQLTTDEVKLLKEHLVKSGVYERYCNERS